MIDADSLKVACAIAVAACIYQDVESQKNDANKLKRLKIAADAIDRTVPLNLFYEHYQKKPEGMSDGAFLLENLPMLCFQPPELWPACKVKAREWGEYTRVMRGLDVFLRAGLEQAPPPASAQQDVRGMLNFITRVHDRLPAPVVERLNVLAAELA